MITVGQFKRKSICWSFCISTHSSKQLQDIRNYISITNRWADKRISSLSFGFLHFSMHFFCCFGFFIFLHFFWKNFTFTSTNFLGGNSIIKRSGSIINLLVVISLIELTPMDRASQIAITSAHQWMDDTGSVGQEIWVRSGANFAVARRVVWIVVVTRFVFDGITETERHWRALGTNNALLKSGKMIGRQSLARLWL